MTLFKNANPEKELEEVRVKLIDPLVKEQVSQEPISPFKTKEQHFQELELHYLDNLKKAYQLSQKVEQEILEDPEIGIKLPDDASEKAEEHRNSMLSFQQALDSGTPSPQMPAPLQQKLNISAESIEKIYQKCRFLYEGKEFEKASCYCLFALSLNPLYPNFWSMLAICQEHLEQFHGASQAYIIAGTLEPANHNMHVSVVRCLLKLDKRTEAEEYTKQTIEILEQANKTQAIQSLKASLKVLIE